LRIVGAVAEKLAELEDVGAQNLRLDIGFWPQGFE